MFFRESLLDSSFIPLTGLQAPLHILLPNFFGPWLMVTYGLTQHAGLAENVLDHRLNCRTVYMNRLNRYLYWNMNYHVEHHMFPMVPYHALPKLHEAIRHDLPEPNRSIGEAFGEVFRALNCQLSDPEYRIEKPLPDTARPYRLDLHAEALGLSAAE